MRARLYLILTVTGLSLGAGKSVSKYHRSFLGNGLHPEVVARTLSKVQDEWKDQATHFLECELSETHKDAIKDCDSVPGEFSKSCSTVVGAIIQGSGGDKKDAKEYMVDVCSQSSMTSWRRDACVALAKDVTKQMTASAYQNRVNFPSKVACDAFWVQFLKGQKAVHKKDVQSIEAEQELRYRKAEEAAAKSSIKRTQEEKQELEKRKQDDEAKKKEDELRSQKEEELDALRKKVELDDLKNARRASKDPEIARLQAVDEAADRKIKEATQIEEGTEDKSPEMKKARDVLKNADAAIMPEPVGFKINVEKAKVPEKPAPILHPMAQLPIANSSSNGTVAEIPSNSTEATAGIA